MLKKTTSLILILLLLIGMAPYPVHAKAAASTADPKKILSDPSFDLNTVDPAELEAWYNSAVNVPDASLKKALQSAANVPSGGTLTVEKMFSLPDNLNLAGLSIANLTGMEYAINVKHLSLGNNNISSLEPLKNLYNLEYLDYTNNQVKAVPSWIFTLRKLTVVNGCNNNSTVISAGTGESVLEELYLEGNKLSSMPDLSGCKRLVNLSLANNAFVNFPATVLSLTNLETLSLAKNIIVQIPDISALTKLNTLNLDFNEITDIPAGIDKLTALQQLSVSNNKISQIPETITKMTTLQLLIMNFNDIQTIPEAVTSMSGLKVLDVAVNNINLSENDAVISKLKSKLETFNYKIQKPNFTLQLLKERGAPKGKLVWSGIEDVSDANEGYTTVTKFVIERKEEVDETNDNKDEDDSGILPTLSVFEVVAELGPEAREYIDETADSDKEYTYRVTAYITGMYMENSPIDTNGSKTISTKELSGQKLTTKEIIIYSAAGVAGLAIIGVLIFMIVRKKKNKNDPNKKEKKTKIKPEKPGKKKKIRKIKRITKKSNPNVKNDTEIIDMIDEDIDI